MAVLINKSFYIISIIGKKLICRGAGTGRQAGLRILCPLNGCVGSNPTRGTFKVIN